MSGQFADHPVSINEIRGGEASTWRPREALVSILRDIDRGLVNPESLVICYKEHDAAPPNYVSASASHTDAIGLLESCKMRLYLSALV